MLSMIACSSTSSPHDTAAPTHDSGCPSGAAPTAEVGTGEGGFEPLADGASLPMIRGPQGGYHVYGSLRATGFDVGNAANPFDLANPRVSFRLEVDGEVVAALLEQPRHLPVDPTTGEQGVVGEIVVLAVGDPLALDGATATFSVEVTDACGRAAADQRTVTVDYASQ